MNYFFPSYRQCIILPRQGCPSFWEFWLMRGLRIFVSKLNRLASVGLDLTNKEIVK